jgi:hypothetical protein
MTNGNREQGDAEKRRRERWKETRQRARFPDVDSFTGFLNVEMRGNPPSASAGGNDKETAV